MTHIYKEAKILIVDDEEITARVLAEILRKVGYERVQTATNASEALGLCQSIEPDLVLLDWRMPRVSGHEVLQQIRATCSKEVYLPVVIVTADIQPESRHEALGSGATDFLIKPYDPEEIVLRVRNLLETRFLHLHLARKQRELEGRLLETRRLATAISNLSSGVVITDPHQPDHPIIFTNPGFSAITGYSAEEVIGRNCRFLQGAETDPDVLAELRHAIARASAFEGRLLNYRKDGTRFWNWLIVNPVFDDQHRLINFVGIQTDVTERERTEDAVRFQAHILDSIGEAVIATNPTGRILYTNRFAQKLYGWAGDEFVGRDVVATVNPSSAHQQAAAVIETLQQGRTWSGEFIVQRRDGTQFPAHVTNSPILDEKGQVRALIGVSSDITYRKTNEEALRQSEERFRVVFDENPLMLIIVDASEVIRSISRFGARHLGYAVEELLGTPVERLYCADVQGMARKYLRDVTANDGEIEAIEIRKQRKDGSYIWVRERARTVTHGGEQLVIIACEDITARKEAQEELDRFFVISVDLLCTAGCDGRFKRLNPAWEATLGWTRDELMAAAYLDFVHPDDCAHTVAEAQRLATGGEVIGFENRYRCKDGSYKSLLWSVRADPERQVLYAAARDITARKQAEATAQHAREEAERANRAKSEFLSRMSHELRTPLNAILGFGQILEMDVTAPDEVDGVQQILKAGRHLLSLVDEVLDISRIDAGRLTLSIEPVAIGDAMKEAVDMVRPLAASRNVRIDQPAWRQYVMADRQRLKQVFLNLLSNAVKYNRDNGSIVLSGHETLHGTLRLSVRDTGRGMSPDELPKLFIPFERLRADEIKTQGSGLGLAISFRLVKLMGGELTVESTPDVGSTFSLELPLAAIPARASDSEVVAAPQHPPAEASCTVLYIEDNIPNLRVVEHIMSRRGGVRLLTAMHGSLGLEIAREYRPDLILLDLHLPDLSGSEVIEQLRQDANTAAIPVVMLSADATPTQIERLKAAGARDYLTKPLDVRQFQTTLDRILGDRNSATEL